MTKNRHYMRLFNPIYPSYFYGMIPKLHVGSLSNFLTFPKFELCLLVYFLNSIP